MPQIAPASPSQVSLFFFCIYKWTYLKVLMAHNGRSNYLWRLIFWLVWNCRLLCGSIYHINRLIASEVLGIRIECSLTSFRHKQHCRHVNACILLFHLSYLFTRASRHRTLIWPNLVSQAALVSHAKIRDERYTLEKLHICVPPCATHSARMETCLPS